MALFQAVETLTCCIRYLTQSAENSSVDPVLSQDSLYYLLITYFFEVILSSISHFSQFCLHLLFSPLMLHGHVIQILSYCYLK